MYLSRTTHGDRVERFDAGRFLLYRSSYSATVLPRHYHENAALMFSARGSFVETVARRTFECGALDTIVRPGGAAHTNRYEEGAVCVIVNVTPSMIDSFATRLFDEPSLVARNLGAPVAQRVARELAEPDAMSPLVVEGLLLELIGEASRPVTMKHAPPWMKHARDYMHAHWQEHPALDDVARAANVHVATLVRAFRKHLRCSPGTYLRRLRLEHAKSALLLSRRPIADVAIEAGFYDQSHFTNAFRRAFGLTPAQFVQQTRIRS